MNNNCFRERHSLESTCHCLDIPNPTLALAYHLEVVARDEFDYCAVEEHRELAVGTRLDLAEELRLHAAA